MVIHGFPLSCCRPEQTATSSREPCLQPSRGGGDSGGGASSSEPSRPGQRVFAGTPRGSSPHPAPCLGSGSAAHAALCFISQPAGALSSGSSWIFNCGLTELICPEETARVSPGETFAHLCTSASRIALVLRPSPITSRSELL